MWFNLFADGVVRFFLCNLIYGHMKADKQLTQTDDAGHKCDIVINNIH
jgi:hypothetical protein